MLIEQLTLRNLLSFGPDTEPLELRPLNILIGPNGSGKSNLLEAIDLLRNAPEQIAKPIREGGGIQDWLWKGGTGMPTAHVDAILRYPAGLDYPKGATNLRYALAFTEMAQRFHLVDERIENTEVTTLAPYHYYRLNGGQPELRVKGVMRALQLVSFDAERSILAQRRDPDQFQEITHVAESLPNLLLFRDWTFGRRSVPRLPAKTDLPTDFLEPDGSNLPLVLSRFDQEPRVKSRFLEALKKLYDGIDGYFVKIEGGTVLVYFHEHGMTIPATRLSDGTLRYLCLLAILCHPEPPPLICIEEPELGLHPDILPTIADLLKEASKRCQLIVTTHSDVLVDCMTDTPEAIVVCEKHNGATVMKRQSADALKPWLERYRLGELWSRGQIGGNRW